MKVEGSFVGHSACVKCSSSDGMAVYKKADEDGTEFEDGFCYVCESYISPKMLGSDYVLVDSSEYSQGVCKVDVAEIQSFDIRGVKERKLKKQYCEMYGMRVGYDSESGEISEHYYPVTKDNVITGYKVRTLPKDFKAIGDTKKCQLFGQHLFMKDGKYANRINKRFCILVEGELDCIAIQQAMSEHGNGDFINAVVSLPSGANIKAVKDNYSFLNDFQQVIIATDQDEPGKKVAIEIAKTLPVGKCKIAHYSEKDACDMIKAGKSSELAKLIWTSTPYSPSGVVSGEGLWEVVSAPLASATIDYPWEGLNEKLHGIRTSELITLVAGSGVAKSTFARAFMYHILKNTDENVAGMFLEESVRKTGLSLMSFEAKKLLHLPNHGASQEEMKMSFENTLGTGRVFLFDSFGSNSLEEISENITFFAKACGAKYIFLDHVSIMVSGGGHGDERKALDEIATKLRTLIQELDVTLFMVCHLKRPEGRSHEEGAPTSIGQLRGSAGIGQLSDIVIGIERNGQADDPNERNTSTLRVLKNRFSGETGVATKVHYNSISGELTEIKGDDGCDFLQGSDEPVFDSSSFGESPPWTEDSTY